MKETIAKEIVIGLQWRLWRHDEYEDGDGDGDADGDGDGDGDDEFDEDCGGTDNDG